MTQLMSNGRRELSNTDYADPLTGKTLHCPIDLAATIQAAPEGNCLLVDSLGTWLANLLELDAAAWSQTLQMLLDCLQNPPCSVIFVAEEVGWVWFRHTHIGRTFRDRLGMLTATSGRDRRSGLLGDGGPRP
jgi:adenosylcobinamide kinase/adenosylcobinamide-phosphate guanylyltransferase